VPLLRFRYGAHLSKEQVADLVAPHPETLELVSSWLGYHGVPPSSISTTHGGGWLTVAGVPVSQANKLLGASYRLYHHSQTNETILRTIGYALPAVLHAHVKTIAPTTVFASTRLLQQTPRIRSGGAAAEAASGEPVDLLSRQPAEYQFIKPPFLRLLYNTVGYTPAATDKNVLGIAGFDDKYLSQQDLTAFMARFRADGTAATFTSVLVNGGVRDPTQPSIAGNLDIQYSEAIAYPTPIIYYTIGGSMEIALNLGPASGDAVLEWLNYVLSQRTVPQTIGVGWAVPEPSVAVGYAGELCLLFAELGVRGASVLVASGNDGVGDGECTQFYTTFPASCTLLSPCELCTGTGITHSPDHRNFAGPHVTSVGGTAFYLGREVANRFSGGGFSRYFVIPEYQEDAVATFFDILGDVNAGRYPCVRSL
jgi:tripeptidyl-peptidase-1